MHHDRYSTSLENIAKAWFKVYVAVVFLVMVGLVILPNFARVNLGRPRAFCQNNLKQIGIALRVYSQEHNDTWPLTLSELYPKCVEDLDVFICGDSEDKIGSPSSIEAWTSYEYKPFENNRDPATTVVCRERESFHSRSGRNELFADGHVSWGRNAEATP